MADTPDRERISEVLGRVVAVGKRLLSALFSVGLVVGFVLVALAIGVYFFDPLLFEAVADSPGDTFGDQPQIFESTTTAAGCAPNVRGNASVEGYQLLGTRHLTVSGNIALADAADRLAEPRITERSGDRFVLAVESRPTEDDRGCPGVAHYTTKIQLPYGTDDYELLIEHDGDRMKLVRANV